MISEGKYEKLETEVDCIETYHEHDFTDIKLIVKDVLSVRNDKYINFELPKAVEVKKGERILFYNCKVKTGKGCLYIANRGGYRLLEIFSKGMEKPYFILKGREASRLERVAAERKIST